MGRSAAGRGSDKGDYSMVHPDCQALDSLALGLCEPVFFHEPMHFVQRIAKPTHGAASELQRVGASLTQST
eukprot:4161851-Lingulodinium_polyedra.AAC.1